MHHCGKTRVWYLRSTRSSFFSLVISADKHHTYKRCKWSKDRNTIGSHKIHFVDVNPPMAYLAHRKTHVVNLASSCGLWFQFKTQQVLCLVTREAQTHQKKPPTQLYPLHTHTQYLCWEWCSGTSTAASVSHSFIPTLPLRDRVDLWWRGTSENKKVAISLPTRANLARHSQLVTHHTVVRVIDRLRL